MMIYIAMAWVVLAFVRMAVGMDTWLQILLASIFLIASAVLWELERRP